MINPAEPTLLTLPHDAAELTSPDAAVLDYAPPELLELPPTPTASHIKAQTIRSSMWTLIGFGFSQVIRFGSNLVLARLLVPHDFGLAALVGMFVNMFQWFSDVGLGPAIIQSPRGDDERFLNTAWTISILRGLFLWVGSCAVAWPVSRIYHEPLLLPLIIVTGFNGVLTGLNSTALFQLNRHMQAGRITLLNLAAQVLTTTVMVTLAFWLHSVWAIIFGGIASSAFTLVLSHFLIAGFRNRFAWDRGAVKELLHFGGWIFVSTAVTFFANDVDRLIFGYISSVTVLGLYQQATTLVRMPIELIGRLAGVSLFPALARSAELGHEELRQNLLRARSVILPLGISAVMGLGLGAPLFVYVVYPGKFQDVGWMARYMSVGLWITILQLSSDRTLLAMGHAKSLAMANGVNMVATISFALAGIAIGQRLQHAMPGFILGVALGNLAGHMVIQSELRRHGVSIYLQDLRYTLLLVLIGAAGLLLPKLPLVRPEHAQTFKFAVGLAVVTGTCLWTAHRAWKWMR